MDTRITSTRWRHVCRNRGDEIAILPTTQLCAYCGAEAPQTPG